MKLNISHTGLDDPIDHLDPGDVARLKIPIIPEALETVVPSFVSAFELRERARKALLLAQQQYRPVNLKVMSLLAFQSPEKYVVRDGWTLITADGRAEENLADPVIVTSDRDGWLASGHILRIIPREGVHPGVLYLIVSSSVFQQLLKSRATGSVVDALSEDDVKGLPIKYPSGEWATDLGTQVTEAWEAFAEATKLEDDATEAFETLLSQRIAGRALGRQLERE